MRTEGNIKMQGIDEDWKMNRILKICRKTYGKVHDLSDLQSCLIWALSDFILLMWCRICRNPWPLINKIQHTNAIGQIKYLCHWFLYNLVSVISLTEISPLYQLCVLSVCPPFVNSVLVFNWNFMNEFILLLLSILCIFFQQRLHSARPVLLISGIFLQQLQTDHLSHDSRSSVYHKL